MDLGNFESNKELLNIASSFEQQGQKTVVGRILTGDQFISSKNRFWTRVIADMNEGLYDNFGYTDWRVPNMRELFSLVDSDKFSLPLPAGHPFVNIQHGTHLWTYWTSTSYKGNLSHVWCLCTYGGYLKFCNKGGNALIMFLWPVRGGHKVK